MHTSHGVRTLQDHDTSAARHFSHTEVSCLRNSSATLPNIPDTLVTAIEMTQRHFGSTAEVFCMLYHMSGLCAIEA